jgi:hypothetical protein
VTETYFDTRFNPHEAKACSSTHVYNSELLVVAVRTARQH